MTQITKNSVIKEAQTKLAIKQEQVKTQHIITKPNEQQTKQGKEQGHGKES